MATWPERAAIGLIAIPVALFFALWFQPLLGIPAAAVVLWGGWRLGGMVVPSPLPSRAAMAWLAFLAIVWTWVAGLGGFFQQMPDHNFRNALLHDLIGNSWPVVWTAPEGTVALDYYLAWSLVPALVGKIAGWTAATLAMAAICATGAFLVLVLFVRAVGAWRWWIPMVFLLWSGLDILGWALRTRLTFEGMQHIDSWCYPPLWYLSHMLNYFCVPHLAIPTWLITLVVAGRSVGPGGLAGLSALLFPLAPYQLLGLLPFVAWETFPAGGGKFRIRWREMATPVNFALPLVALAMCAPLYLGNLGAGQQSGWFFENSPSSMSPAIILAVFVVVEVLLAGAAILWCGQRDRLVMLALVVLCLIPLRQSGLSNDLALKASMPGLAILTLFTAKALVSAPGSLARWFLIGVFTLGAITPLHELRMAARWTLKDPYTLEEDFIRTFDPSRPPTHSYRQFLSNFRSRPLEETPLLRWMLGVSGSR